MNQLITKQNLEEAAQFVRSAVKVNPQAIGIVLGSGLGDIIETIDNPVFVNYADVPHMVASTAPSHSGRFVFGSIAGKPVICMQGRLHGYEGNSAQQIAFPICLLHVLGVTKLVLTNAAGGINPDFAVGDLMLIEDHINLTGENPLVGVNEPELFPRFFDMTDAYASSLRQQAMRAAQDCDVELSQGVYIMTKGPSFETPAEIRAFRLLGADAVGMSTVFETIAARACGMDALGISMISNPAAGVFDVPVSIDDVYVASQKASKKLAALLKAYISSKTK